MLTHHRLASLEFEKSRLPLPSRNLTTIIHRRTVRKTVNDARCAGVRILNGWYNMEAQVGTGVRLTRTVTTFVIEMLVKGRQFLWAVGHGSFVSLLWSPRRQVFWKMGTEIPCSSVLSCGNFFCTYIV